MHIRRDGDRYLLDYCITASFAAVKPAVDYDVIAAKRGVLEYLEFPSRLTQLSCEWLEGRFTRDGYRLVRLVRDAYFTSPFAPSGRWQKLPPSPTDLSVRARLVVEESMMPDSFAISLNRLSNTNWFDTVTIRYEPHPSS
jgi:hypothetical protein